MARKRTVLICGDSILDNAAYVGLFGRSVHAHLKKRLDGWDIDFRALDGAVSADVPVSQLPGAPKDFDAVVLSVGGNDALGNLHLLESPERRTLVEHGMVLADVQDAFRADYRAALEAASAHGRALLALTIYRPRFHLDGLPAELQRAAGALLSLFNDVIQEEAAGRGDDLLDLRRICISDSHFANAIEPNDAGGREIAEAIARWLQSLAREDGAAG